MCTEDVFAKRVLIMAQNKNRLLRIQLLERRLEVVQKTLLLALSNIFILGVLIRKRLAKSKCAVRPMILCVGAETNQSVPHRKLHLHGR